MMVEGDFMTFQHETRSNDHFKEPHFLERIINFFVVMDTSTRLLPLTWGQGTAPSQLLCCRCGRLWQEIFFLHNGPLGSLE